MVDWEFAVWMSMLGALVVASFTPSCKRAKSMVPFADHLGLRMWGDRLPPELTLAGTPIGEASVTWNLMQGRQNGVPFVLTHCLQGCCKAVGGTHGPQPAACEICLALYLLCPATRLTVPASGSFFTLRSEDSPFDAHSCRSLIQRHAFQVWMRDSKR